MKPGRELDALIATKVMGFEHVRKTNPFDYFNEEKGKLHDWIFLPDNIVKILPNYSTDIASSWLVVDKLEEKRIAISFTKLPNHDFTEWTCIVTAKFPDKPGHLWESDSFQYSVCIVALHAVGHLKPKVWATIKTREIE